MDVFHRIPTDLQVGVAAFLTCQEMAIATLPYSYKKLWKTLLNYNPGEFSVDNITCQIMAGVSVPLFGIYDDFNFILLLHRWKPNLHYILELCYDMLIESHMFAALKYVLINTTPCLPSYILVSVILELKDATNLPEDTSSVVSVIQWFLCNYTGIYMNLLNMNCGDDLTVLDIIILRYPVFALSVVQNPRFHPTHYLLLNSAISGLMYADPAYIRVYTDIIVIIDLKNAKLKYISSPDVMTAVQLLHHYLMYAHKSERLHLLLDVL